ncbi:MAG: hypothetical protein J3Q66DRAFT_330740 [Benniella sp.]|nr:MAG: hypothetical protein J3Q66DRAFT_330740 [Benniella sp.]
MSQHRPQVLLTLLTEPQTANLIALFFFRTLIAPHLRIDCKQLIAQDWTMQESAPHLVFAIPELVTLIAQYLSRRDISAWMMTCKALSRELEPCLWSHMSIPWTEQEPIHLYRYLHHFRSLKAFLNIPLDSIIVDFPSPTISNMSDAHVAPPSNVGLPCLNKLSVYGYESNKLAPNLIWFLYHSPNLTEFDFHGVTMLDPPSMQVLFISLAKLLPRLKRLSIKFTYIKRKTAFELLDMCFDHSQLIHLQCDFSCGGYKADPKDFNDYTSRLDALLKSLQDADKAKAEAGLPTGLSLKSLMLPNIWDGYPKDFLVPFLRSHVPNLERFRMPGIHEFTGEPDIQVLAEAISVGCPRLRHLSHCWQYGGGANHEYALIAAIHGCAKTGGLKSYSQYGYCERGYHKTGPVISVLLMYHADTLEEIKFRNCRHLYSQSIQTIATTCKNLRTLIMHQSDGWPVTLRLQDVSREWVCRDLTVLHLMLDRDVTVRWRQKIVDVVHQAAQGFFAQIGRLTKLEELSLDCKTGNDPSYLFCKDLTLEDGWLAELSGLKKLWHLEMLSDYWSPMSQEEVEFMDTNWPNLEKISFGLDFFKVEEGGLEKDHWKWLKNKRPYIIYE